MAISATLPTVDKRLIRMYLLGVDTGRGVFGSITTVAVFQRNEKVPRVIVQLMRQHRRSTATTGICFNITLVIPSGRGLHFDKALIISTISTMMIWLHPSLGISKEV
ncbi:hypothetical protein Zmor_011965 [Zophobas morio]|uniref:Uncharacterized protein n=1 Tax=Zophobas morio TaxID=2755281 RepID=A0AA38HIW4_9CUCU|nr:hypothetical protein Zmor_011965 [Zophobas morio]